VPPIKEHQVPALRSLVQLSAILAVVSIAAPASAQDWPAGTTRIVVPYAAGGPVDFPARLVIDRLATQTKGVFILENRPGAGGSIGLTTVVQAPPDGGTFLFTTSSVTMVPTIYPKLAFDPLRDLTAISLVTEVPTVWRCAPSIPRATSPTSFPRRRRRPANIPSRRAASAPAIISPASFSRSSPASTCCTCRSAASRPR
jgi:hypothetical protein